jgi:hypothetical protein
VPRADRMGSAGRRPGVLRGAAYGVPFEIRVDDRRLLLAIRQRCPPGWKRSRRKPRCVLSIEHGRASPPGGLSVSMDGIAVASELSHAAALDVLESELQLTVARFAEKVFVHAGAVALGDRVVLLPGRSGAGKTTLVRALVDAGATYYSDEYAVIDARGRVHPYARRPSIRTVGASKERIAVPRRTGRRPRPVGFVIATEYSRGAKWAPQPLTRGECVLALLSNTVPARDRPRKVLTTLAKAVGPARGLRSPRGSTASVVRTLVALAAERAGGDSLKKWTLPSSPAVDRAGSSRKPSTERPSSTSKRPTKRSA